MSLESSPSVPDGFRRGELAAAPALCVPAQLPPRPKGRTIVVGAGKAAASMGAVVEAMGTDPRRVVDPVCHG